MGGVGDGGSAILWCRRHVELCHGPRSTTAASAAALMLALRLEMSSQRNVVARDRSGGDLIQSDLGIDVCRR